MLDITVFYCTCPLDCPYHSLTPSFYTGTCNGHQYEVDSAGDSDHKLVPTSSLQLYTWVQ